MARKIEKGHRGVCKGWGEGGARRAWVGGGVGSLERGCRVRERGFKGKEVMGVDVTKKGGG